jgi:hypothetical protein
MDIPQYPQGFYLQNRTSLTYVIVLMHSTKTRMEEHYDQISVFYLPSYSPERNPDEYLNCDLKAGVHSGTPVRKKGDLKKRQFTI